MRVWFSGRMSPSQGLGASSILADRTIYFMEKLFETI